MQSYCIFHMWTTIHQGNKFILDGNLYGEYGDILTLICTVMAVPNSSVNIHLILAHIIWGYMCISRCSWMRSQKINCSGAEAGISGRTMSNQRLQMPCKKPCYRLCRINRSLCTSRRECKYMHHLNVAIQCNIQICSYEGSWTRAPLKSNGI